MIVIKQGAAVKVLPFLLVDSADHITGKTGLTPTVTLSKNGAAFGSPVGAVTETGNGWYKVAANATDSDTIGSLVLHATASGADPADTVFDIVAYDPSSATNLGLSNLDAAISTRATPAQVNTECDTALADVGVTTTVTGRIDATISSRATPAQVATELTTYGALKPTVAARTLDVSATGEAGVDWANVGSPTTVVGLSGTTIKAVTDPVILTAAYDAAKTAATQASVTTLTGYVDTEVAAILAAVDTEVAAIKAKTDNLPVDPADASDIAASFTSLNTKVDTIDDFLDTEVAAIKLSTDHLATAMEVDGGVYRFTTNALEQAPVGGGGGGTDWTAGEKDQIRHRLGIDGSAATPAAVPSLALQVTSDAILAKTNNIPSDPADASDITASFSTVNGKLDVIDDYVDTELSAIKAKTDQLNFSGVYVKATLDGATVALAPVANDEIADAVLKRDWTLLSGEAAYSLLNASRLLRNAWNTTETPNNLTVKKEDGSTTAWTRPVDTDAAAEPIVGLAT